MPDLRKCDRPPTGWYCTRAYGHPGSCPTRARWWMRPIVWLGLAGYR